MAAEFSQLFCFEDFTDKSILIPLKNTFELKYQHHDLQETWRFINENRPVHKPLYLKKIDMCLPLPQRFKKMFA